jgi:hypothetical protein
MHRRIPETGKWLAQNRRRIFRLPRRADQQPGAERVPIPRCHPLAPAAMPAQPKSKAGMDADGETGRRVPPQAASPSSLAQCALRRQTPEVGAECPNWARSDLCGGRSAMSVPTASKARPAGPCPRHSPGGVSVRSPKLTTMGRIPPSRESLERIQSVKKGTI